jgi:predicted HicB family RNase H-like nuclease
VDELRQAFEDSIEDYIEICISRGEQPEKPFSGRFTVHLSPEEHRRVVLAASRAGKRVDNWVADALGEAAQG